jgi:Poxvirus A32 protein.
MKVVKQKISLDIDNVDLLKESTIKHSLLFPMTLRCLVIGPSNCGKTNVIMNLLEHINGLKFENVCVCSKSLNQDKYIYLKDLLKPIKGIGYKEFSSTEDLMEPSKAPPNSVFIFDDVACDKQDIVRDYFCRGRHNNVDCFYLCQTYVKIPKHLIRDNANSFVIFKQDDINLKHLYQEHIGTDMSFEQFKEMCSLCWTRPFGFVSILKDCDIDKGRYRKGFDHFIYI